MKLGANVVIYGSVEIEEFCEIQDGAVIGKPLRLGPDSSSPASADPVTTVARNATVCCKAVLVAGA